MDIEKHISNLKQYIKDDEIIEKDGSDFANFCKVHIDDIQAVLNELEKYKMLHLKSVANRVCNDIKTSERHKEDLEMLYAGCKAELEKKDNKIKELEERNRIFALEGSKITLELYIKENYIPKQKIKDKLEELEKNELLQKIDYKEIKFILDILQELLQESEDK